MAMDQETLAMLAGSLRHVLAGPSTEALSSRLDQLGWSEVVADDRASALGLLFRVKGETRSSADALDAVLAAGLAADLDDPGLAAARIVLPSGLHPDHLSSREQPDGTVEVDGVVLGDPAGAPLVVPIDRDGVALAVVAAAGTEVQVTPIGGIDPGLGLHRVTGRAAPHVVAWSTGSAVSAAWERAVTTARWTLAAELVGVGRHTVEAAVAYAKDRHQYGRPIGSFQALQHRLADAHAALVGAQHVVDEAATSQDPWTALVAKAVAGRACEEACRQAQQTYGAIGFTWEHEFHLGLRRCYALDALYGDWRTLEVEIGTRLRDTRSAPKIGALL